jgi:hypothetical protein
MLQVCRDQPLIAVFLGQIENNCDGFREHHVTVDEDRKLSGRINFEECGTAVLGGEHVDGNGLEVDGQFLKRPPYANPSERIHRASWLSPVDLE